MRSDAQTIQLHTSMQTATKRVKLTLYLSEHNNMILNYNDDISADDKYSDETMMIIQENRRKKRITCVYKTS